MNMQLESLLVRWVGAGILDPEQAGRIRQYEASAAPPRRSRWPILAALVFGGAMLAAGILLFVSAHWNRLSPVERMTLLIATVGALHTAAALSAERFAALATTLHAVGSVALGGAIAVAGQIFHMQEHWPAAILLWALGAAAGWLLLRDWPHVAMAAILAPWWLAGEWLLWVGQGGSPAVVSGVLLLAISYLSTRTPEPDSNSWRIALAWLGGLAILPVTLILATLRQGGPPVSPTLLALGWAGAILIPLAVAFVSRGRAAWMNLVAAMWVLALHAAAQARAEIPVYVLCAAGSAAMVAWGVHEFRAERINLGMAGFAATLIFFFFSSVMDKLGRSASLMALGALCVGGGWYWEKLRRELTSRVPQGGIE